MLTERQKRPIKRKSRAMSPLRRQETARGRSKLMSETRTRVVASQETMIITVMAITEKGIEGTTPKEGLVPGLLRVIRQ